MSRLNQIVPSIDRLSQKLVQIVEESLKEVGANKTLLIADEGIFEIEITFTDKSEVKEV